MDREDLVKRMRGMYGKAAAARKEGKLETARQFRRGARRLQRMLKRMPKPAQEAGGEG